MGAITSMATIVGGLMAGTGAAIVTENAIIEHGLRYATTKFGKVCVGMCALTVGEAAFTKVNDMFTDQAMEFWELVDKAKKYRAEVKVEKGGKTILDVKHDGTKTEAEEEVLKDLRSEEE